MTGRDVTGVTSGNASAAAVCGWWVLNCNAVGDAVAGVGLAAGGNGINPEAAWCLCSAADAHSSGAINKFLCTCQRLRGAR